jgi:hypothetical protein
MERPIMAQARKTFVFVPGAWHGGWCWQKVTPLLEKHGHKTYTNSLTGLGERSHLLSPSINLDTHIADVVNLFEWEDLEDACLVAHSYGGWPSSGALERIVDRVSAIVWVDAFLPKDGERNLDTMSDFTRKAAEAAVAKGEPGSTPPKASLFSQSEADIPWIESKLTPQPVGISFQPIKLTGALQKVPRKTYIRAPKYPQPRLDRALNECKADPSWTTYVTEDAHHDVMIDAPEWLAEVLLKHS